MFKHTWFDITNHNEKLYYSTKELKYYLEKLTENIIYGQKTDCDYTGNNKPRRNRE